MPGFITGFATHGRAILRWSPLLVALLFGLSACNDAGLSGATANSSRKDAKKKDDNGDDDDDDDTDDGGEIEDDGSGSDAGDGSIEDGSDAGDEGDTGDEGDITGTGIGSDDTGEDQGNGGILISDSEATCLLKKGNNFRVMFALDNSGSTTKTDPGNIRRTAAMKLVDQFTDFVVANPKAKFKTSTVAIHGGAKAGSHGWVTLAEATRADIEADVMEATTKDSGSGTHFLKGFEVVDQQLQADNAVASDKTQRTYIIFLTDGQANGPGDSMTSIPERMQQIVDARGAAVYSIMIGKGGSAGKIKAPELMQSLALPVAGIVAPDHKGTYIHAPDPTAIEKAFADFFKMVTTCE